MHSLLITTDAERAVLRLALEQLEVNPGGKAEADVQKLLERLSALPVPEGLVLAPSGHVERCTARVAHAGGHATCSLTLGAGGSCPGVGFHLPT